MRLIRDDSGITAILLALLFPVILLFFSAILDAGSVLLTKRQLQVVADAASAAGASRFEVFGEPQGATFVVGVRVTSDATAEATTAIDLNAAGYNFSGRNVVIFENTQTGIGTDSYTVTLSARVPTLLMGRLHNAFMGGAGQYDTIVIMAVSTTRIVI